MAYADCPTYEVRLGWTPRHFHHRHTQFPPTTQYYCLSEYVQCDRRPEKRGYLPSPAKAWLICQHMPAYRAYSQLAAALPWTPGVFEVRRSRFQKQDICVPIVGSSGCGTLVVELGLSCPNWDGWTVCLCLADTRYSVSSLLYHSCEQPVYVRISHNHALTCACTK